MTHSSVVHAGQPSSLPPLPPPSLSQQDPPSQQPSGSTFPCTQGTSQELEPHPSADSGSVLAPDSLQSEAQSEETAGPPPWSGNGNTIKVSETVLLQKKKDHSQLMSCQQGGADSQGPSHQPMPPSPVPVVKEEGRGVSLFVTGSQPLTSTQVDPLKVERPSQHSHVLSNHASIVGDSHLEGRGQAPPTSTLPGLQTSSSKLSKPHTGTPSQPHTGTPSQSTSVLAPCSLTPDADAKLLPDSRLLSSLFARGREEATCSREQQPPPDKRLRLEDGVHDNGEVALPAAGKGQSSSSTGSLPCGSKVTEGTREPLEAAGAAGKTLKSEPQDQNSRPPMEMEDLASAKGPTTAARTIPQTGPAHSGRVANGSPAPVRRHIPSQAASSTPFISTRKRRQTQEPGGSREEGLAGEPQFSADSKSDTQDCLLAQSHTSLGPTQSHASSGPAHTQIPFSSSFQRLQTPFSTGGKRNKIVQLTSDLWEDDSAEQVEGEDPLESQCDGPSVPRVYRPVLAPDGFIQARATPQLQVSRQWR